MRAFASLALIAFATPALAFDPTDSYVERKFHGFTVRVNPEVSRHAMEEGAALKELDAQLARIGKVVPPKALTALQKIPIWVEWEAKPKGAAEFHVAASWLKANGYNPDKLRSVEINNTRNFVAWSRKTQPWMVLHELAHAYHFTVLGDKHAPLQAAYRQALERKLYDEVEFVHGGKKRKAYATTSAAEYFAELSEAYFGKNDFYPFTRADLEKHDPAGFEMVKKAWGEK